MFKRIDIYVKGEINSRELYEKIKMYQPCVIDLIIQTYVCVATDIHEDDCEYIKKVCREYGECEIYENDVPIA